LAEIPLVPEVQTGGMATTECGAVPARLHNSNLSGLKPRLARNFYKLAVEHYNALELLTLWLVQVVPSR
jgi:hypothetical protein